MRNEAPKPSHPSSWWRVAIATAAVLVLVAGPTASLAEDFVDSLKRVDKALSKNPKRVPTHALVSCQNRRNFAARLYEAGQTERAERSLRYCYKLLKIPEQKPAAVAVKAGPTEGELQARATRELEAALDLTANVDQGLEIYRGCAACHSPEGWGLSNGLVPQIAGQHRKVVIKQLADIRAGNRDNVLMAPYSAVETIGGTQAVADVAGYIDTLEISVENGKGPGDDLELGKRSYEENCARCHGVQGEGDDDRYMPRIQAQHYQYMVRQFEWIRDGKRRNSNAEMVAQIANFDEREMRAVLDYVSR
ncbi:MAG: c-type cytochrome, partial [Myxococcota bacterium]